MIVSDISSLESLASQSMDKAGKLYYLQLTGVDNLTVLSHLWNGSGWILQESKELYVKDQGVLSFITAAVSSKGTLLVSVLTSYLPPKDDLKGRILSMSKSFEVPDQLQDPSPAIIP